MFVTHDTKSRTRKLAFGAAGTLLASAAIATPAMAAEPPAPGHEIISFPQRDFVSASGYAKDVPAYVQVIRAGHVVATSTPVLPEDDPATTAFDGIVEVNHPGGGCWDTVTPDIRPGDKVRVYQDDPAAQGEATQLNDDTTTTAAVTATKPALEVDPTTGKTVVTIHGTAQGLDATGNVTGVPLPLAQIEQRLINKDKFSINGRRDLRAPRDTTISYDAADSINWTVRYPKLTGTATTGDVAKALKSESRVLWLGRTPAAGTELTIFEVGPDVFPGPEAPCIAPLEGTSTVVVPPVVPDAALDPATTAGAAPQGTHSLTAFPSRDFVSAEGYTPGELVKFSVVRNGTLVGVTDAIEVGEDGLVEVNHPGGGCWLAGTQTPNIRPGDVVRISDASGVTEQTTVANVTASKPVKLSDTSVQVTGTALNADRTPMSLGELEQRLVNPQGFTKSGKRTLRAPGEGILTIDAAGAYTATYTGLSGADVTKAMAAESRALWLGPDPVGSQMTIFEAPDVAGGIVNGPQAPCTAPAEAG
jgi:hypothetical protein